MDTGFHTYITRRIPGAGPELLAQSGTVSVWEGETAPPREELLARAAESDALLCLLTDRIDADLMDAAPKLKVVSAYSVGTDNVDLAAATQRGICVCNTPGILTDATADLAWALLMAAARRVVEGDSLVRAGKWLAWGPSLMLGQPVAERTLGIIGMGRIGRAVARRAVGFAMPVLYHARHRDAEAEAATGARFVDMDTLLRESDFVSIHTPLTPETKGLMDADALAKMKPTAVLVNTSRGPVVDQDALASALKEGRLFAAGLDVFTHEPIPSDDPLLSLPNVVALPHIGSADVPTRENMSQMAAEAILDVMNNRLPAHLVNFDVWDRRRGT